MQPVSPVSSNSWFIGRISSGASSPSSANFLLALLLSMVRGEGRSRRRCRLGISGVLGLDVG